jgi:putative protein-disulfide isomerase
MNLFILSFISLLFFTSNITISLAQNSSKKPTLIYVFDPLCGWCYGISPVISKIASTYKDVLSIETVCGGMITDDQIGSIKQKAPFLKKATALVTQHTGAEFSRYFIDTVMLDSSRIMTSVQPSIAIMICKEMKPEYLLSFIEELHKYIYIIGIDMTKEESYLPIAKQFGMPEKEFLLKMKNKKYKESAIKEFRQAEQLGIQSFPALLLQKDGKNTIIANGYKSFQEIDLSLQLEISK